MIYLMVIVSLLLGFFSVKSLFSSISYYFRYNSKDKGNYIIERHITRENKSSWCLNRKAVSQKVVISLSGQVFIITLLRT